MGHMGDISVRTHTDLDSTHTCGNSSIDGVPQHCEEFALPPHFVQSVPERKYRRHLWRRRFSILGHIVSNHSKFESRGPAMAQLRPGDRTMGRPCLIFSTFPPVITAAFGEASKQASSDAPP